MVLVVGKRRVRLPPLAVATIIVFSLVGALGLVHLAGSSGSCTVGMSATDLNITVDGINAHDYCDQLIESGAHEAEPLGELVCRLSGRGTAFTVRDQGVFKFMGTTYCADLKGRGFT